MHIKKRYKLSSSISILLFVVSGYIVWILYSNVARDKQSVNHPYQQQPSSSTASKTKSSETVGDIDFDDIWLKVPIPIKSHFSFDQPPTDIILWKQAQIAASQGKQNILEQILQQFPDSLDFIDGDLFFKQLHKLIDVFIDTTNGNFDVLNDTSLVESKHVHTDPVTKYPPEFITSSSNDDKPFSDKQQKLRKEKQQQQPQQPVMVENVDSYLPGIYDFTLTDRAPLVLLGYNVFDHRSNAEDYFEGKMIGHADYTKRNFLYDWQKYYGSTSNNKKNKKNDQQQSSSSSSQSSPSSVLKAPFLAINVVNENFGVLSTVYPNRTTPKGTKCCPNTPDRPWEQIFPNFLNHPNTLIFVINQHSNYSHPKILTLPIGLKLTGKHTAKLVYDSMIYSYRHIKKKSLLYTASSNWHKRPQIIECVSKNIFPITDFDIKIRPISNNALPTKENNTFKQRSQYYQNLAGGRFVLGLPGIGYDCYRNWEALTMGAVLVMERGVGLDRTLWRLPALLVDDFADITSQLLRSAYVEALYRTFNHEFEFERLTQSYYWRFLTNISITKNNVILYEKYPMKAEDITFTRPEVEYACGKQRPVITCGRGTKRIPVKSC